MDFDGLDDDLDICYECQGYGNDYFRGIDGELYCACNTCPVAERIREEWCE